MQTTEMTTEILNDLVQINNDRIKGYERAIKELEDGNDDLKELFTSMRRCLWDQPMHWKEQASCCFLATKRSFERCNRNLQK